MKPGLLLLAAALSACASATPAPATPASQGTPAASAAPVAPLPLSPPDVELLDSRGATVGGRAVPMDGVAEGLAWPALRAAVSRKPGDHAPLTIAVARDVPLNTVMRAVWTLRDADLRVQTPDAGGALRVLPLHPRPDATTAGCHLAVFVAPNGDLRVAYPGGPRSIPGPDAAGTLAQALAVERARCSIRFVAFGADSDDAAWSSVFDVAEAVDRDRSAGDARYVLGEPVHTTAAAAP